MKKIMIYLLILLGLVLSFGIVRANSSLVEIRQWVMGAGGGSSSGGEVRLNATLGQPVIGYANAGETQVHAGYWAENNNLPPTAADDGEAGFSTDEDSSFTTANVLTNDSDPDGGLLVVLDVDTTGTVGQVSDNGDGTFDFDPHAQFDWLAAGENTTDSFYYTVSDGQGGSDTALVTILITGINDAPLAVDDADPQNGFMTDKDTAFTTGNVLENDSDAEGDSLTIQSIDLSGTIGLVTDNGDGTFDYDPNGQFENLNLGESITDSFTYTISDGYLTDTAAVTITITAVKDTTTIYLPLILR